MVAPTWPYILIALTAVDADSPLDETLMTAVVKDIIHLEEWLGDGYTAAKDHDHDNVNSKAVAAIAANAVNSSALKTDSVGGDNENIGTTTTFTPVEGFHMFSRRNGESGTPSPYLNNNQGDSAGNFSGGIVTDGVSTTFKIINAHVGNADRWDFITLS